MDVHHKYVATFSFRFLRGHRGQTHDNCSIFVRGHFISPSYRRETTYFILPRVPNGWSSFKFCPFYDDRKTTESTVWTISTVDHLHLNHWHVFLVITSSCQKLQRTICVTSALLSRPIKASHWADFSIISHFVKSEKWRQCVLVRLISQTERQQSTMGFKSSWVT